MKVVRTETTILILATNKGGTATKCQASEGPEGVVMRSSGFMRYAPQEDVSGGASAASTPEVTISRQAQAQNGRMKLTYLDCDKAE